MHQYIEQFGIVTQGQWLPLGLRRFAEGFGFPMYARRSSYHDRKYMRSVDLNHGMRKQKGCEFFVWVRGRVNQDDTYLMDVIGGHRPHTYGMDWSEGAISLFQREFQEEENIRFNSYIELEEILRGTRAGSKTSSRWREDWFNSLGFPYLGGQRALGLWKRYQTCRPTNVTFQLQHDKREEQNTKFMVGFSRIYWGLPYLGCSSGSVHLLQGNCQFVQCSSSQDQWSVQ